MKRISQYFYPVALLLALGLAGAAAAGETAKVDINKASQAELEALRGRPGPGAADPRLPEQERRLPQVEDLLLVSGIGERTFALLRDQVTVSEPRESKKAAGGDTTEAAPGKGK